MQIPSKKTKKFEFFYFGADGPDGRYLTGQKGLGQPLRTRPLAVFFGELRPATCGLRLFHEFVAAERRF